MLLAMVREAAYCGRGYEHALRIGPGHELVGVFHQRRIARGSSCGIELLADHCSAFPDEAASDVRIELPVEALPAAVAHPRCLTQSEASLGGGGREVVADGAAQTPLGAEVPL